MPRLLQVSKSGYHAWVIGRCRAVHYPHDIEAKLLYALSVSQGALRNIPPGPPWRRCEPGSRLRKATDTAGSSVAPPRGALSEGVPRPQASPGFGRNCPRANDPPDEQFPGSDTQRSPTQGAS